jgi:hypothetical protein
MFEKKPPVTPLETRKQLLVLESELNRAQLLRELGDFQGGIRHLKHQAGEIGSVAASAARLAALVSATGRVFSHRGDGETGSWISTLLNGAKAGASWWLLFRSFGRKGPA